MGLHDKYLEHALDRARAFALDGLEVYEPRKNYTPCGHIRAIYRTAKRRRWKDIHTARTELDKSTHGFIGAGTDEKGRDRRSACAGVKNLMVHSDAPFSSKRAFTGSLAFLLIREPSFTVLNLKTFSTPTFVTNTHAFTGLWAVVHCTKCCTKSIPISLRIFSTCKWF